MKILMSAYACEPNRGSEPGVGWNWALQAARFHDVWVLTRANNREVIEKELSINPQPRLRFIYHDLPKWARWWKRGGRGISLYYYLWQLTAIPKLRAVHRNHVFDIAHHITFVSFRFPSALTWLDIPFVWGPVAGAEGAPRSFYPVYGIGGSVQHALRDSSNRVSRFDPFVRRTRRKANVLLAATAETAHLLDNARIIPAIGISSKQKPLPNTRGLRQEPLRLLYVGNLLYLKGLQLALPAFAQAISKGTDCTFTIIGSGPYRSRLEEQIAELDLHDRVRFCGQLGYNEVQHEYTEHHVFLFPSLRDSGGMAVLEAMLAKLPIVCLDLGGPGSIVTKEAGITVPAKSPGQVVEELAAAIIRLAQDPVLREHLGNAGYERVTTVYSWDRKGEFLRGLYEEIGRTHPLDRGNLR